ncbi:MAG: glutathione S-transferase [Candidatus Methylumidiphilus alinenensis]|uniref:Glutathione S-transferase n=1 Tax=Candidatus Methylumidiphilus alinenensis TaxID=2202197 RepID=A0A2W4R5W9_9GAMM|nr:MAG: glutathione S-transferase [Candidatus Methylumidiphilus alinenensis]
MIKLHQLARTWGIPNLSHFCVKIETYLRMTKQPYQVVDSLPLKGPRGKLPFIVDKDKKVSDSRLIVNYLKSTYGDTLDAHLSAEQKAIAKSFQRLLEEHLYWISMTSRWNYTEANWQTNKKAIFSVLPPVARDLAALVYRRRINSQILGHGIGRLSSQEAFDLGKEDIDALADFLADKPYFMGDKPTSLDASAYGILVNTLGCPIESPIKDHALTKKNLVNYCQKMQAEFFPELAWGGTNS